MSQAQCEYCGQEERYGHNAICVMNTVEELRAEIERLRAALTIARDYIADQPIANAVVVPKGQHVSGHDPSLLNVIDAALGHQQKASDPK